MSDTEKRLKEALYYAKKGWPVIPLHTPGDNGCSCGNYDCRSGGKHPRTKHGAKDGTTDKEIIREWWQKWPDANIGIATGRVSGLVVVDIDPRHGGDQSYDDLVDGHEKIDTLEVITGSGGRHIYFAYPHDRHIGCPGTDLSGIDIRGDGGLVVAPLSKHRNGRNYQWEESSKPTQIEVASMPQWMMDVLLPIEKEDKSKIADPLPDIIPEGERHTRMVSMAGSMRHRGVTAVEMLEAIRVLNQSRCKPPLLDEELEDIVKSIEKYPIGKPMVKESERDEEIPVPAGKSWPEPMQEEAFYGLAGDIVRTLEPHTESDPAALLIQFLIGFGNLIGRGPHFKAEADEHFTNEFAVVVGRTSKGRKGTSAGLIRRLFESVDPDWINDSCVPGGGLSTGEGLIWHVRDTVKNTDGQVTEVGVTDKRMMIQEPEFAAVLKNMRREMNTLSPIIRTAWDGQTLRTLTKNSPLKASNTHVSIVGHITAEELRRYLNETESANGFGNRFIWICANRSKLLPEGGQTHKLDMNPLLSKLRDAVEFACKKGHTEICRDKEALDLWYPMYRALTREIPGLLGAITGRAEAHVMRLALIYALLDKSDHIKVEHLKAARAVWQYAEASAEYIFGTATGNHVGDRIRDALKDSDGMTQTDIDRLFNSHKNEQVVLALAELRDKGFIESEKVRTDGRPKTTWRLANGT